MTDLPTTHMASFGHNSRLMRISASGAYDTLTPTNGAVAIPYEAGDVVLANRRGDVLAGPTSLAGATEIATQVLSGDERIITNPRTLLVLAMAIVAFGECAE